MKVTNPYNASQALSPGLHSHKTLIVSQLTFQAKYSEHVSHLWHQSREKTDEILTLNNVSIL